MIELKNLLPKDLNKTFDSLDYDADGGLKAHSIKYFDNELHFDFSLYLGHMECNETQLWQLQVKNYRDSNIDIDNLGGYFYFYSDHFLLWEFTDVQTGLYFKKATDNPERLLADIYSLHNTVFDNYISIDKFLNGNNLLTLCNYNHGLFAFGPKQLLKYYFDCLKKARKEPYYYGEYIPQNWDGEKRVPEDKDLKVAILDRTYFIGETFEFKRLDK